MLILCHDDSIGTVIGGLEVDCKDTAAGCFELASVVLVPQVNDIFGCYEVGIVDDVL
jgi:hypothetical protein